MKDDYLWDKSGEPEDDVRRLEGLLGRYRLGEVRPFEGGAPPRAGGASRPRTVLSFLVVAAAAAVLFFFVGPAGDDREHAPVFTPERGNVPAYDLAGVTGRDGLGVGEQLELTEESATLKIADLGEVRLRPGSRMRVLEIGESLHRLYLAQGEMHATILAPPRLFQVGTPAGRAIDLGCEYTLRVTPDGDSVLAVTAGQVAFEFDGREVYVPAGATCTSRRREGPGVPVFDDADPEFRAAVERVESAESPDPADVERVVSISRRDDALTLWHLLDAPSDELRAGILDTLERVFPKPAGVTRAGIAAGDEDMRADWMESMKPHWRRGGDLRKFLPGAGPEKQGGEEQGGKLQGGKFEFPGGEDGGKKRDG